MADIQIPARLKRIEVFVSHEALNEIKRQAKSDLRTYKNFMTLDLERRFALPAKLRDDAIPCPPGVQPTVWQNASVEQRRLILDNHNLVQSALAVAVGQIGTGDVSKNEPIG